MAGGGTLITFPVLTALGVPPVAANVTNTVALCPGFLGATVAQRRDLRGQGDRLGILVPVSAAGGIAGGLLLLSAGEQVFRALVPYLIFSGALLLAAQGRLRAWLVRQAWHEGDATASTARVAVPIGLGAVYGGYFGAGLGVVMLAVMGLLLHDSLTRLNALKSSLALTINVAAAIFFMFSGTVVWPVALVMGVGALVGGHAGGRVAARIRPDTLRWTVVTLGIVVGLIYLIR